MESMGSWRRGLWNKWSTNLWIGIIHKLREFRFPLIYFQNSSDSWRSLTFQLMGSHWSWKSIQNSANLASVNSPYFLGVLFPIYLSLDWEAGSITLPFGVSLIRMMGWSRSALVVYVYTIGSGLATYFRLDFLSLFLISFFDFDSSTGW